MSRLSKLSLLSVVLVSVLILGVLGGVAIAQSGVWQRPGDDVATIHDADAALAYWNDIQRDTDPAHEQLWSAFGEMVDNLMELDIRTRNMAGVPTPQVAAAADGTNGTNGEDGSSCSVSINGAEDEVTISCTDGSSVSYPVTPPPPPLPPFLVVAYINDDGIDGFSERDTLIAGIFDANGDGVVSVGDQIRTDQYPLDVDASSRRPFGKTAHAVTSVISVTPVEVQVGTALSEMLEWINGAPGKYEAFSESGKGGLSTFWDCWGCSQDELSVDVLSPSTPSTPTVDSAAASGGDHVFLDVDILVS